MLVELVSCRSYVLIRFGVSGSGGMIVVCLGCVTEPLLGFSCFDLRFWFLGARVLSVVAKDSK